VDNSRYSSFVERFKHGLWYKPACTRHRVMGLVPRATLIDLANNIEKVAALKGELLGCWRTIGTGRANDFLRRDNGGRGPGDRGQRGRDIWLVRVLAVERFPEGLHGYEERRKGGSLKSWVEVERMSGKADQPRVEDEGTRRGDGGE
jgi:hypothetical protein